MRTFHIDQVRGFATQDVFQKKYNLWVGVSDTPWFAEKDNLEALVQWALDHTRERILVFMPGRMYAVNYNHIEHRSRARALREGFAAEDRFRARLAFLEQDPRVRFTDYDMLMTPDFIRRRALLYREFSKEGVLYQRIIAVIESFLRSRKRSISKERLEAVALYLLQELPLFIAPIRHLDYPDEYEAVVYPGMGAVDDLARDLVEGRVFPELTRKLNLTHPCGCISLAFEVC